MVSTSSYPIWTSENEGKTISSCRRLFRIENGVRVWLDPITDRLPDHIIPDPYRHE
jgi:hypothetical protein